MSADKKKPWMKWYARDWRGDGAPLTAHSLRAGEDLRSVWPLTAAWHWCGEHAVDAA